MQYDPAKIEKKWQKYWEENNFDQAEDFSKKPKKYILIEFPYPSGEGLHVGHVRSYAALDAVSRKKRMEGFNVLFPIGWDAFGLPTENYAIKTGVHPSVSTGKNVENYRRQLKNLGLSFDWSREINTTDPKYYKWTQWIFLKLFEKGLAYQAEIPINFCPACKIGLANEEVVAGNCERCGAPVEKKVLKQWMIKITAYADRLIEDLKNLDYPEKVKLQQINWIGKSFGTEIDFKIESSSEVIKVFTTRADTLFGVTAVVLAPENPLVRKLVTTENQEKVKKYIEDAKKKSDLEREQLEKEKTGVFTGSYCLNPVSSEKVPIWIGDYVVASYGGGAVMVVPDHDDRDRDFAKKYKLEIRKVVKMGMNFEVEAREELIKEINKYKNYEVGFIKKNGKILVFYDDSFNILKLKQLGVGRLGSWLNPDQTKAIGFGRAYTGPGFLINSGRFNGLFSEEAKEQITQWLEKKGLGRKMVQYKLRDWVFSRQHYWGEPIPIIHCEKCGAVAVPEKDLPVELPYVEKYQPTGTGESPLANISDWVNVACPECGGAARRETDTMPNWAGSNWYYMRYTDPRNEKTLADNKKLKYWLPVDWYNGGFEHTTLHLLYSRFIYKFLFDIGATPHSEPYQRRTSHGIVLAQDQRKMSKSFGNVINPDDIVKKFGADTLRLYEMFMGPFDQAIAWDDKGVVGMNRFLDRVYKVISRIVEIKTQHKNSKYIHKTIKKVSEDIENMKFNTALSALMIFFNGENGKPDWRPRMEEMHDGCFIDGNALRDFLILLSPFAPHIAEELWQKLGNKKSIFEEKWPEPDKKFLKEETITLVIQINGKVRDKIEVKADMPENEAKELTISRESVRRWIQGKEIKKIIFVPGKLINIVV